MSLDVKTLIFEDTISDLEGVEIINLQTIVPCKLYRELRSLKATINIQKEAIAVKELVHCAPAL